MLAQIGVNRIAFKYGLNLPSTLAIAVTPGASNAEGSWTQVASAANIAEDIYYFTLWIKAGSTSGQQKDHLLDIGIDPAGGTSYTAIISNIVCGESEVLSGLQFTFPFFIPAGSSVAVRIQGSNATAGTVSIGMTFFGQPSHPELIRAGQYSETIGTITNSGGVTFTPGSTDVEGSWVSLGTTSRGLWMWQLGVQCSAAAIVGRNYTFDLAYGDGSNKVMIIEDLIILASTNESVQMPVPPSIPFCEVPAGGELFVRGSCSGTITSGWNAVAVGVGG